MQRYVLGYRSPLHLEVEELQTQQMGKELQVERRWMSGEHLLPELPFALPIELG